MPYRVFPFGQFCERFGAEAIEKLGVDFFDVRDHGADDGASFAGRVRGGAHPPQTVEDDAGDGVHHSGESCNGQDVARAISMARFSAERSIFWRRLG